MKAKLALCLGGSFSLLGLFAACVGPSDATDLLSQQAHSPPAIGADGGQLDATDGEVSVTDGAGDGALPLLDGATALALAEQRFLAIPGLIGTCGGGGGSCHVNGTSANMPPTYLAGPDAYVSIKAYDAKQSGMLKFIVSDPTQSRLFTKGQHAGPGVDAKSPLGLGITAWLNVEAAALKLVTLPQSASVTVTSGTNISVDISPAAMGVAGAKITFDALIDASNNLKMSNLKLVAPATTGVHVVHPIFVQVPAMGDPINDPADNFSNVDQTVGAGQSAQLGDGTVFLTGLAWAATDKLAIQFTKLEAATVADGGGATGGCKNLAGFTSIAGVFTGTAGISPTCTSCHATGGSGDGAMDLNGLTIKPTADFAGACNQALLRVNKTNKAQSDILLHPAGMAGNHGGGTVNDVATYQTMINSWISGE